MRLTGTTPLLSAAMQVLGRYLYSQLQGVPGVRVLGPASSLSVERTGLVAFTVDGLHTSDLAFFLDQVCMHVCIYVYIQ